MIAIIAEGGETAHYRELGAMAEGVRGKCFEPLIDANKRLCINAYATTNVA